MYSCFRFKSTVLIDFHSQFYTTADDKRGTVAEEILSAHTSLSLEQTQ
jgi:hypothetical protein